MVNPVEIRACRGFPHSVGLSAKYDDRDGACCCNILIELEFLNNYCLGYANSYARLAAETVLGIGHHDDFLAFPEYLCGADIDTVFALFAFFLINGRHIHSEAPSCQTWLRVAAMSPPQ